MFGVLWALRISVLVSSFRVKQSSLDIDFSPMHTAFEKRFAVDLGSKPCLESQQLAFQKEGMQVLGTNSQVQSFGLNGIVQNWTVY